MHCLSEWSHNFRPAYMALGATLRDLGVPAVLGLTATATMRTVKSVCTSLRLPPDAQLRNSPHRPNLTFSAELMQTRGDEAGGGGNFGAAEDARVARIVKLVSEWAKGGGGGGAIIYCMRKYQCEQLAAALRGAGLKADHYHAGRPQEERQRVYARFMSGQLRVVAATVAFGMGIDKANVRLVVHAGLPRSLEQWVQETGRAGRDGAPAACHAVLRPADFIWLHSLCHSDHVAPEQMAALLRALTANAKNGYGDLPLDHLETKLDMNESVVQTALAFLAEVPLRAWRPPAADGDGDGDGGSDDDSGDETLLELLPQIRRTAVLSFHQERPEAVAAQSPLVGVLLRHAKEHNGSYRCPLVQAASEVGLDAHAAHAELAALHRGGVLQFELRDPAFYVRFHCAPKQTEVDELAAAMTAKMAEVEELQRTKLAAAATVLWALADDGKADGGGGASDADGGATPGGGLPTRVASLLTTYFEDATGGTAWAAPLERLVPPTLRGDVFDFCQQQLAQQRTMAAKPKHEINDRVVARLLHGLTSARFPRKQYSQNHYWGRHMVVDFHVVREIAAEVLATLHRKHRRETMGGAKRK